MAKIELKAKVYAKRLIENKFNGTQTATELYNAKTRHTAKSIASENLTKPVFQKAIIQELEKRGVNKEFVSGIHKRNIQQDKNLPASNTGLDMYYKLEGDYAPEKRQELGLNINLNNPIEIDNAIKHIQQEIRELEQEQEHKQVVNS